MEATDLASFEERRAARRLRRLRNGVEGNARLTGGSAAMLLALLAIEGATIPFIGSMVGPHIFVGMLLIPPVLLKIGSTGYRFLRYYSGSPAYVRKGPPPALLRLLGPVVVLTSLALFASGVALLVAGPPSNFLKLLHKASFILWFGAMTIHVLGHLLEVPELAAPDWRRYGGREAALAGSGMRVMLLLGSLVAGLMLALLTLPSAGSWLSFAAAGGGGG